MATTIAGEKRDGVVHIEQAQTAVNLYDAAEASAVEHSTSVWQALKENKKAVFWSMIISLCIVMEGYDVGELI